MARRLIRVLGILVASVLFLTILPGAVHAAAAAPSSECHQDPSGNGQFICNIYESDGKGNPSEISNVFTMQNVPIHEFIALVENPNAPRTDPKNWSDLLVIQTPTGGSASAQLFSQGCNNATNPLDISCYPATEPNNLMLVNETSTGQGNDFTDSTVVQFGATSNVFSDCACAKDLEGGSPGVEVADAPLAMMLPVAAMGVLLVTGLRGRRRTSTT